MERHGVDSKAGQTRNAWRPSVVVPRAGLCRDKCGFALTPLATACRSTLGARLFSVRSLSGLKMARALVCLCIGQDARRRSHLNGPRYVDAGQDALEHTCQLLGGRRINSGTGVTNVVSPKTGTQPVNLLANGEARLLLEHNQR